MPEDYGVTGAGFELKRLDQILAEINADAKGVFGDNLNVNPESPEGQIHAIFAEALSDLYEISQVAFNAYDPRSASGVQLDYLAELNGLTRLVASPTVADFTLVGVEGTVVPQGTQFSLESSGEVFSTTAEVVISSTSTAVVEASSVTEGVITYIVGDIVNIDTPVTGLSSIQNTVAATQNGTDEETDVELRVRRQASITNSAQSIVDSIFSGVSNVTNVTATTILENATGSVDGDGLPAHSFEVIVVGGSDDDVAQAIWLNRPAGIPSFGTDSGTAIDIQGISKTERFTRAEEVDIYVNVTINTFAGFPNGGEELIKQNIVDFANGDLLVDYNFTLGDEVLLTRLYMPVNAVQGHFITSMEISSDGSTYNPTNISMGVRQIPKFTTDNINVTVVQ